MVNCVIRRFPEGRASTVHIDKLKHYEGDLLECWVVRKTNPTQGTGREQTSEETGSKRRALGCEGSGGTEFWRLVIRKWRFEFRAEMVWPNSAAANSVPNLGYAEFMSWIHKCLSWWAVGLIRSVSPSVRSWAATILSQKYASWCTVKTIRSVSH